MKFDYRADIDGLRAVAVLSVLFYHYGFSALSGGFTGVDVFFVISGFVITAALAKEVDADRFSLVEFYNRRIRRIVPALLLVLLVSMVVGYFILVPGDYEDLGRSSIYSAFGAANFYFLWHTGYFDQAAEMQPLLHMWSLGVEEQFYLVWPLALAAMAYIFRKSKRAIAAFLGLLIAISLGLAIYTVEKNPSVAFYMLHTRAWELALGALLVFLPKQENRLAAEASGLLGVGLIAYGMLALSENDPFPGLNALYPCVGAALIIWPKVGDTFVARVLSLRPVVFIGLISYSLYLWHWPILVFFRNYANGAAPTAGEALALIALVGVVSYASWRYVEKPLRKPRKPLIVIGTGAVSMLATACLGLVLISTAGFLNRLPPAAMPMRSVEVMWEWNCPQNIKTPGLGNKPLCVLGAPWAKAERKGILWGDSHVLHFAPLLDLAARRQNVALVVWHACPPFIDNEVVKRLVRNDPAYSSECAESRMQALKWMKDNDADIAVLAASWSLIPGTLYQQSPERRNAKRGAELMRAGLLKTIKDIDPKERSVVILSDVPPFEKNPSFCAFSRVSGLLRRPCKDRDLIITEADMHKRQGATDRVLREVVARNKGASLVAVDDGLCENGRCHSFIGDEFIYRDNNHIRRNLTEQTKRRLVKLMNLDTAFRKNAVGLATAQ
ncbi:acyltransferase [Mesorhizobium sp. CGMCC 1.15528]|uniref:Acyltransferase n=1 Tax=Mesorhizobium zhangyense TaxID=1776730 RepID=A0A7C9VEW8_9HYPH|nr:acyltransferase family protein [Mesorhizobium zhangyense]NGN43272.1 acyltransferase [Mesorhizobium zhangyense]